MARPSEKLAESLEVLNDLQSQGIVAIRSAHLSRTHRERLQRSGFIQEVMKGWYIPSRPDQDRGESTGWYASFWGFCGSYLSERFDKKWCLSPDQSILLHTENRAVPAQLLVRAARGGNKPIGLLHNTSLLVVRAKLPPATQSIDKDGLRLYSLPAALVFANPEFFRKNPLYARAALNMVQDASSVLDVLLSGGHSTIAGRLGGAFRSNHQDRIADTILQTMQTAGYSVHEADPFDDSFEISSITPERSPYVNRIRLMWQSMRSQVLGNFPAPPGPPSGHERFLAAMDEAYVSDAYHSLSIEGYRVSPELIERVRSGTWDPENDPQDREHRDALAARGYYEAFQAVRESVRRVLQGADSGDVAGEDHGVWYRHLFAPSVRAGILEAFHLAGYRSDPVHIRMSRHVPPRPEAVRDLMPAFFDLLREEEEPQVRVVLGHFIFVFIHPYSDGNGRCGRFLMNLMLAAGGYPWTVVPVAARGEYMAALEAASVDRDIVPFSTLLARFVESGLRGLPAPEVPRI